MKTQIGNPVQYSLELDHSVNMNELIGQSIQLSFTGKINCVSCGKITKKAFGQGFCYNCFISSPDNAECIIRPELCEAHTGGGRDAQWEKDHHFVPHVVYLALSSALKVGVTRHDQVPVRWIDQGAWKAIKLAEVPYRQLAGKIEVSLKSHLTDKTNWQQMLKNVLALDSDLHEEKSKIAGLLDPDLAQYVSADNSITEIIYPVNHYPTKVKSLNLDTTPVISGKLEGIKGQYLLFEGDMVINLRKFSGYFIKLTA